MFLRGFKEVIMIAVVIVGFYLALNVIVLVSGIGLSGCSSVVGGGLVPRGAARRLAHGARRRWQRPVGRGAGLPDLLSQSSRWA